MANRYHIRDGSAHTYRPSPNNQTYQVAGIHGNVPSHVGNHSGRYRPCTQSLPTAPYHYGTQAAGTAVPGIVFNQRAAPSPIPLFAGTNQATQGGYGMLSYAAHQSGETTGRRPSSPPFLMRQGTEHPHWPRKYSASGLEMNMYQTFPLTANSQAAQAGPSLQQYPAGQLGTSDGHTQMSPPAPAHQATQCHDGMITQFPARLGTAREFAYLAATTEDKTTRSNDQTEIGLKGSSTRTRKATLRLDKAAKGRYSHVIKSGDQLLGRRTQPEFSCKFCPEICSQGNAFREHLCRKHNLVAPCKEKEYDKCPSCGWWYKVRKTLHCGEDGRPHKYESEKQYVPFWGKDELEWTPEERQEAADIFCLETYGTADKDRRYQIWEVVNPDYFDLGDQEGPSLPVPAKCCKDLPSKSESSRKTTNPASAIPDVVGQALTDANDDAPFDVDEDYPWFQQDPTLPAETGDMVEGDMFRGDEHLEHMQLFQQIRRHAERVGDASAGLNEIIQLEATPYVFPELGTMQPAAETGDNVLGSTTGDNGIGDIWIQQDIIGDLTQSERGELSASA